MPRDYPSRLVVAKHMLRNALNPFVTLAGYELGTLLGGSALVEAVMNLQGLGTLMLEAVRWLDVYLVIGSVLAGSVLLLIGNLLADIALAAVDPRIDFTRTGGRTMNLLHWLRRGGLPVWMSAALLGTFYLSALFAPFVTPYDPAEQNRRLPNAPPSILRGASSDGVARLTLLHPSVPSGGSPRPPAMSSPATWSVPIRLFSGGHLFTTAPGTDKYFLLWHGRPRP